MELRPLRPKLRLKLGLNGYEGGRTDLADWQFVLPILGLLQVEDLVWGKGHTSVLPGLNPVGDVRCAATTRVG